jgi:hypothetical protein
MIERRTALALALLVGGLALGAIATPSVAQEDGQEYNLSDLKPYGVEQAQEGAPPSMRWLSQYGSATIRHEPQGIGSEKWTYLEPGGTVHDDEITLQTVRVAPASELDETLNVTVVSWQRGEREVVKGNQTVTRPTAKRVNVRRAEVRLGRGYDNATIDLPSHYDETWQISMWVEEYPDARWRFEHRSVETSRSVPFEADWGGFWSYNASHLLIPLLIGVTFVGIGVPSSLRRTARGPNIGFLKWSIALALIAGFLASSAYVWTASLLASAPIVVAGVIAALLGIIMLETIEYGVYDVIFLRLFQEKGANPRGEVAAKVQGGEYGRVTLANVEGGVIALTDGLESWLARLFCGGAYLQLPEEMEMEFSLGKSEVSLASSPADKLLFVDHDVENLIEYEPEHLELDLPLTSVVDEETGETTWNLNGIATVATYLAIGSAAGYGGAKAMTLPTPEAGLALGLVVVAVKWTRAVDGKAWYQPALGHTEDAVATAMYYDNEIQEYERLEEALQAIVEERHSEDDIVAKLAELSDENVVTKAYDRDTSAEDFIDDSGESAAAGGDD